MIVFASNRGQDRGGEIYAVGPTGGTSTNLSRSSLPDLAPVAMLAFPAPEPNSPYTDLVVVDREGNQLATFPKSSVPGKWIVYSKAGDLWLVRPDGRGLRRLTSGPAFDTAPSWQPVYG